MADSSIQRTDASGLARLIGVGRVADRPWRPEDLGAILRHQMSSAVQFDLGSLGPEAAAKLGNLAASEGLLVKSFADLFAHPHPPVELLISTKDFAKAIVRHPDSPLPDEVGRVLYFASIVGARLRCKERITELDDAAVRDGIEWALGQAWVDDATQALFEEGRATLRNE